MKSLANAATRQKMSWREFVAWQLGGLWQWFYDLRARSALREQMADLDRRGGLDSVLTDLGISRPALESIIRGYPQSGRLLPEMAKRLGIDLDKLDPRMKYEIQRSCASCPSPRRCRRWLATADAESTEYRAFCPNAELFEPEVESARQS